MISRHRPACYVGQLSNPEDRRPTDSHLILIHSADCRDTPTRSRDHFPNFGHFLRSLSFISLVINVCWCAAVHWSWPIWCAPHRLNRRQIEGPPLGYAPAAGGDLWRERQIAPTFQVGDTRKCPCDCWLDGEELGRSGQWKSKKKKIRLIDAKIVHRRLQVGRFETAPKKKKKFEYFSAYRSLLMSHVTERFQTNEAIWRVQTRVNRWTCLPLVKLWKWPLGLFRSDVVIGPHPISPANIDFKQKI